METVYDIILKPDLSRFCIDERTPLFSLLGTPRQEPLLLLWCYSSVAPRWPHLLFSNVGRRFIDELFFFFLIDPTGFMRVKMNISLRKRTLSPVRLVLEDSSKRSFMLFVVVSLHLGSII